MTKKDILELYGLGEEDLAPSNHKLGLSNALNQFERKTLNEHIQEFQLYKELVKEANQQARKDLLWHDKVKSNDLNIEVAIFRDNKMENSFDIYIEFYLNGSKHTIERNISRFDFNNVLNQPTVNQDEIPKLILSFIHREVISELSEKIVFSVSSELLSAFH